MKRRQVVLFGSASFTLLALFSCDSEEINEGGGSSGASAGSAGKGGAGGSIGGAACSMDINATSAISEGHSHAVTIPLSDIIGATPGTYTFSTVSGHTHTIELLAADLTSIRGGGSVTVTSSLATGGLGPHDHEVTLACA